jgi:hypothetical protein
MAYPKGQGSANPGGRHKMPKEVKDLLEDASYHALRRLVEIMTQTEDLHVALKASIYLTDRYYGKPTERVDVRTIEDMSNDEIRAELERLASIRERVEAENRHAAEGVIDPGKAVH